MINPPPSEKDKCCGTPKKEKKDSSMSFLKELHPIPSNKKEHTITHTQQNYGFYGETPQHNKQRGDEYL